MGLEQELEEQLAGVILGTDHECAACSDKIEVDSEIVCITVVAFEPVTLETGEVSIRATPVSADDGDFLYEPRFLEYECWEDVVDELYNLLNDNPPIIEDGAVASCRICESSILPNEVTGLATKGEIQWSPRTPEYIATHTFDAQDPRPDAICISCLKKLSAEYLNLWDSVEQGEECSEGTDIRCWRHGCPGKQACILGKG